MTLISNPVYWQNLPSTTLKPDELDRVIHPIMDTLYHYQRDIRANSIIIKGEKRNVCVATYEVNLLMNLDKKESEKICIELKTKFFSKKFHIFNGINYKIEEQIGDKNQLLIEPILTQTVVEKVFYNKIEAEFKIIPIEGIYIEFLFQSDEVKTILYNNLHHYGNLVVYNTPNKNEVNASKQLQKFTKTYLKIIQFYPDENTALIRAVQLPQFFDIQIEPNTSVINKKIRAIQSFFERPKSYYFPILRLFERYKSRSIEEDRLIIKNRIPKEEFKYLNDDRFPGVEEQREFVNIALNTPDFAILEGPPGSGKTTTILEILHQATKQNQRILMVASTNVAVNNVLERIDEEREKGEEMHIFPIRLGIDADVHGVSVNYLLNNISKKETDRIVKALKAKGKSLKSIQKDLLLILEKDRNSFDSFVLDMANVVCGTTIGILHYPAFDLKEFQINEPFDMLIIDEASKTTLQEFLVPALLAKKWIIIGDKMQLSPFIEEGEIKTLVNRCHLEKNFEKKHQWICTEYFSALDFKLVITDLRTIKGELQEHIESSAQEGIIFVDPYKIIKEENRDNKTTNLKYKFDRKLMLKQINQVLGCKGGFIDYRCFFEEELSVLFETLPMDLDLIVSPNLENLISPKEIDKIQFKCKKQRRKLKYYTQKENKYNFDDSKIKPWIEQIGWRLKRLYELRHQANSNGTNSLCNNINTELELLLPKWNLAEISSIKNFNEKDIRTIKNALRIKAYNLNLDYNWDKKRIIEQQFNDVLTNSTDISKFFDNYNLLFNTLNDENDKTYLKEELIWFAISTDNSKEWFIEFYKRHLDIFKDLLTYQIGNYVYDMLRIEFPSIIELLQEGLMVEPKYRNTVIYNCTIYKGYRAKKIYWQTREGKLTYQHRMHPDISKFVREHFYDGKQVLDPDGSNNTYNISDERVFPFKSGPHNVWYYVRGNEIKANSFKNLKEVEKIYEWYCEFEKWAKKNPKSLKKERDDGCWEIAIITFYLGQEYEISNKFRKHFGDKIHKFNFKDDSKHIKLKICTVDSFQGQEADIVLLSFVRTKRVGFLDSRNRLNVALSRAKYYQILFGNHDFFKSKRVERRTPILYDLANTIPHISSLR